MYPKNHDYLSDTEFKLSYNTLHIIMYLIVVKIMIILRIYSGSSNLADFRIFITGSGTPSMLHMQYFDDMHTYFHRVRFSFLSVELRIKSTSILQMPL